MFKFQDTPAVSLTFVFTAVSKTIVIRKTRQI